jgi:tetraprenyl-beta-curcumene synthase
MNMSINASPRLALVRSWPGQQKLLARYIFHTLPRVKKRLQYWRSQADRCPDIALADQALSSLTNKDFHCYGGAVFAPGADDHEETLIELITAYQTICDYLDNLCDRNDCLDGNAFRQLHVSLEDALKPAAIKSDYYKFYPHRDDGGYLNGLVDTCKKCLEKLPSYEAVQAEVLHLAGLYMELQVRKHIDWSVREQELISWAEAETVSYEDIFWQEFAAASGSTLAIFALFALAARSEVSHAKALAVRDTYFPWICGLHILLDYFIDREEDRQGSDLNFTFYYQNEAVMQERLKHFIRQSHAHLLHLANPTFTRTVVEGLLAMYLSDRKVKQQGMQKTAAALLNESGPNTWHVYRLCALVRRFF